MTKEKEKGIYLAPELTAVSFWVERGFNANNELSSIMLLNDLENNQRQVEDYTDANNWTSGSIHFWD